MLRHAALPKGHTLIPAAPEGEHGNREKKGNPHFISNFGVCGNHNGHIWERWIHFKRRLL